MKLSKGIVALSVLAGACFGQESGLDVIGRVVEHYQTLKGASVDFSIEVDAGDNPMAAMFETMEQTTHGYAVRPNLFAFWGEQEDAETMGMPAPRVWCDGTRLVSAVPDQMVYSVEDAPASLMEAVPEIEEGEMPDSVLQLIPGADLLLRMMAEDPSETVGRMLGDAEYKGTVGEGDAAQHVFLVSADDPMSQGAPMEVFVAAVGQPWVVALKPDLGEQAEMVGDLSIVLHLNDWKPLDAAPEDGRITVADDWRKVDSLVEELFGAMMGGDGMPDEEADFESPDAPATDVPAAGFTLEKLGGGEFSLTDQRGKVVVLDFWATWCPPCVAGLPVVSTITAEYAPKGVVFAAVNLMEKPEQLKAFMEEKGWDFTVLLDADGSIADQYGATAIPQSVLIDKQGVIRHVEVGFAGAEEAEKMLRENLDKLIAE